MWSAKYRAYGNLAALDVAEIDNPLRFQGQYFDAETGLHYNRHRYYNPGTGRFLTPDPIKLAGGLNNYQYVPNPTGWVDPMGLTSCPGAGGSKPEIRLEDPPVKATVNEGSPPPPAPPKPDKWSREPKSIQDQMTLQAAKEGRGVVIIENLNDPAFKGMDKIELKIKSKNGNDSVVHYVRNPQTGELMDFKFKKHSTDDIKPWGNDPSVPPGAIDK
jgi:RHS repeat-associated protein